MKAISISDGVVEYYGNRVGVVGANGVTVDKMFRKPDLEEFLAQRSDLTVEWKDGVYDRLISGEPEPAAVLKKCRIYQLKPDVDVRMKFVGCHELENRGFGKPDMGNYRVVFDGEVGTNDPEEIYALFNRDDKPEGYTGYSLSVSDVIELYDEDSSELQYVDTFGFVRLDTEETHGMKNEVSVEPLATSEETEDADFHTETFKITM